MEAGGNLIFQKIEIPANAVYIRATSRDNVYLEIRVNTDYKVGKLNNQVNTVQENVDILGQNAISTNRFLNNIDGYSVSLSTATIAAITACYLDKEYALSTIGDYIEIEASNPSDANRSSNNITMFRGTLTNAGFLSKSFYFRSNSNQGADYRIWVLPANFDKTILHKYRIELVADGWELFVDGVSMGVKPISQNCLINVLLGLKLTDDITYNYKSVAIHSQTSGDLDWKVYDILNHSTSNALMLYEDSTIEIKQDVSEIKQETSSNTTSIQAINKIYASDNYYSTYNRNPDNISGTSLQNSYQLKEIGDYFEIEARYWGSASGYSDKMALVQGDVVNSRFGWYARGRMWFRVAFESYKQWDEIPTSIDWSTWHKYRLEVVNGGFELFIDGVSMGVKENNIAEGINYNVDSISSVIESTQKYDVREFTVHSAKDGDLNIKPMALYAGSANVELVYSPDSDIDDNIVNPLCFVSYNGSNLMQVYMRDKEKQNIYYMLRIHFKNTRGTANDPIWFQCFWEIDYWGAICIYNKELQAMTETTNRLIAGGESECVFMYTDPSGSKVDFTGGVHGDESIDIDPTCFVRFYINGVPLTNEDLATAFSLRPCNEFYYLQRSAMHETAIRVNNKDTGLAATGDGVLTVNENYNFVIDNVDTGLKAYSQNGIYTTEQAKEAVTVTKSGSNTWVLSVINQIYPEHPIIAHHVKKTSFSDQQYRTENTLIFNNNRAVSLWYHGICCLAKDCAQIGHNEEYVDHTFIGAEGANALQAVGLRMFEAYNPDKKMSGRVTSEVTDGGGVINDNECDMFIVDRANDSKYYRTARGFVPPVDKRLVSVMNVEFNSNFE